MCLYENDLWSKLTFYIAHTLTHKYNTLTTFHHIAYLIWYVMHNLSEWDMQRLFKENKKPQVTDWLDVWILAGF